MSYWVVLYAVPAIVSAGILVSALLAYHSLMSLEDRRFFTLLIIGTVVWPLLLAGVLIFSIVRTYRKLTRVS